MKRDDGTALVTVLMMMAVLMPLGAFAVMQARTDVLAHHYTRAAMDVQYIAESGLEHALADLRCDPTFERLLAGPDGTVDTPDDATFPFRSPPPAFFPEPPARYEVGVVPGGTDRVDIVARGLGVGTSTHTVAATVRRSAPLVPGAVASTAAAITLVVGDGFTVSGIDRAGREESLPGLALPSDSAAQAARAAVPPEAAGRLQGSGNAPSIAATGIAPVEALAAAFASDPQAQTLASEVSGSLGSGILVSSGSLQLADSAGSGVLIVRGTLQVTGQLAFDGLVMVLGDLVCEPGSSVRIAGGVLQGLGRGQLHFLGTGSVSYDSAIVAGIDTAFPGRLPRRARVSGRRDLS